MDYTERKNVFRLRKLEMLRFIQDKLERRMAALSASIETLEKQIERDSKQNKD
tara:strand:- start:963 stop:1121 length:159 start_codon:yes stop_codon:yes gene_type:complete